MFKTKKQMMEEIAHLNAVLKCAHDMWEDLAKENDKLKAELAHTQEVRDDAIKDAIHLSEENKQLIIESADLTETMRQTCCKFVRQKERADELEKELASYKSSEITAGTIQQSTEEYRDEYVIPTAEKGWEVLK